MNCISWAALREFARAGAEPPRELLTHLQSCPQCQLRFEREGNLTRQFSALRQLSSRRVVNPARQGDLLRRFHAAQRSRIRWKWPIVAAAAMLLVSVAVVDIRQARSSVDIADAFADEGYTAVPYAVPLATGEFVRVLRADLPASSLVQMGLDLDSDIADVIPVDLVIGEDDQPRAVRVVQNDF